MGVFLAQLHRKNTTHAVVSGAMAKSTSARGDRLGGRERRAEAELLFDGGDLVANRWHQVTMLTSAPSCEADLANLTWCALVRRASPPRRPQASSPGLVVFLASEPRSARRIFLTLRFLNAG